MSGAAFGTGLNLDYFGKTVLLRGKNRKKFKIVGLSRKGLIPFFSWIIVELNYKLSVLLYFLINSKQIQKRTKQNKNYKVVLGFPNQIIS